ncbi:MAG TPA: hypothetical protein VJ792_02830 [Candidatus Nitrosotalea sp.]|nr:hypothetical protein [Candidatus Nitrosotalea sp.]
MTYGSYPIAGLLVGLIAIGMLAAVPGAFATTWYPGETIKQGDFYRYNVCWTDWHNCTPIEIDFWVKNQTSDGNGWNLEMVAIDGSNVQKGTVSIGTDTPDPTYSDSNIADYSNVYKNTIAWLDAFSSKTNQQTLGSPSWGRTGSVGGQSVTTMGQTAITVQAGTFQTWILGWHKDVDNMLWIDPHLSFPVKAIVYTDVTSGVPPPDFTLELLQVGNSATEPSFMNVKSTTMTGVNPNCPAPDMVNDATQGSATTDSGSMIITYRFSPATPHLGCSMEWRLAFEKTFDQSQKYSNVQYDIFTVDSQGNQIDSVAQDTGRSSLFAPVGDDDLTIILKGTTPVTNMVIAALGTGPVGSTPDTSLAGIINFTVNTLPAFGGSQTTPSNPPPSSPTQPTVIPAWVKNNAKWWSQGQIGDDQFVQGIQYMIQQGIIQIPSTQQGGGTGTQQIPAWIKNNAGWWSTGQISDDQFVQGLQYMITNGIIKLHS